MSSLPSAEELLRMLGAHKQCPPCTAEVHTYRNAVLEAAAEVVDNYLVNPAFCCEGVAEKIRALKEDP